MKIGIVGYGYVGKALAKFFENKYEVFVYDPLYIPNIFNKTFVKELKDLDNCNLLVVAVPTQMNKDKSCNISIVEEVIQYTSCNLILIKSTVEPGTSDSLANVYNKNIVFSPEFIGEGGYNCPDNHPHPTDMSKHKFHIFGGKKSDIEKIIQIYVKITGANAFFYQTDRTSAELIKYMENTWLAMKVTFANEMYEICKTLGVSYWDVREGWALDGRTEKSHTAVFSDSRGYSNKCLPKDTNALVRCSEKYGYDPKFIKAIIDNNERFKLL